MPIYSNDSILKYLNFIYLRLHDGFKLSDEEYENTYKYYKEYCIENELEWMPFQLFYRELKKVGISSKQYNYPNGRRARRRVFNVIELEKFFDPTIAKPKLDSQVLTMRLGDKWYKVTVKLEEVIFDPAPSEVKENNN